MLLAAPFAAALEPPQDTAPPAKPAARHTQPIKPAAWQPGDKLIDMSTDYGAIFEIPSAERLFRLESEQAYRERFKKEYKESKKRDLEFPKEPELVPPGTTYAGRLWPVQTTDRVAAYVCYNPLYFEDLNSERYGWDAGIFQPLLSTGKFYVDLLKLPYEMGIQMPWHCEYNSGYCLPGDPVSYYLYYPRWSWKGAALQAGVVLGAVVAIP